MLSSHLLDLFARKVRKALEIRQVLERQKVQFRFFRNPRDLGGKRDGVRFKIKCYVCRFGIKLVVCQGILDSNVLVNWTKIIIPGNYITLV